MGKNKYSKQTKRFAAFAFIGICASIGSIINDKNKAIKTRNSVITTQDFYICELEQFIMDNITGYEFPEMVGIPN